ncbi:pyruvate formate lyase activating enzyme [Evansella vedderi]|uniref:Pyruvate formate-lyase-activating enzyme n=1 Tax=Evansella vedderi TaxID=38282 RepID=A0ABT9ZV78_9BACI|nr:pyruvate formate-lyase-activating protein [Evansella vedderi]MDQ0255153.1 pyruvate formate lyase activating enzyme [Evansella vedderi]
MKGYVHSIETCGTVDGPGIRYVLFLQGCPLQCLYCHNPDTWKKCVGDLMDTEDIIKDIIDYLPYMQFSNGGITVSGGEALLQPEFVLDLFTKCKELGIHTTLDTGGSVIPKIIDDILEVTDLVLLDLKHIDEEKHKELTGLSNKNTLKIAKLLMEKEIPVWIRHVLVPGITNDKLQLTKLGNFIAQLSNVEKVEVLPYHKMGEYKWEQLGLVNTLKYVQAPTAEEVDDAYNLIMNQKRKALKGMNQRTIRVSS